MAVIKEIPEPPKPVRSNWQFPDKLWLIWSWRRALIHWFVGVVTPGAYFCTDEPVFNAAIFIALVWGFLRYETNEDKRLKDMAFVDIQGWLIGLYAGAGALLVWNLL